LEEQWAENNTFGSGVIVGNVAWGLDRMQFVRP
jgi:hypothetical protein